MNQIVIEAMKKKPLIPKDIEDEIRRIGFITGSRIFGGFMPTSDIDILIPPKRNFTFQELLEYGIYIGGSHDQDGQFWLQSIYVNMRFTSRIVNLLLMDSPEQYQHWERATILLKGIKENIPGFAKLFTNKTFRVNLFEMIKSELRKDKIWN